MTAYQHLHITTDAGVRTITLDRAEIPTSMARAG